MATRQQLWWRAAATFAAFAIIAGATLWPDPHAAEEAARTPWTCLFPCGDQSVRDAILNVILFIPFGLSLRSVLAGRRALLVVALTTVAIEFTQYHWLLGRDASLRDILANTAGGALGIWLTGSWRMLILPGRRRSAHLATATGGLWLVLCLATGFLVRPSIPLNLYWGQWAPELGQFDTWHGTLLEATVNGDPLPKGRFSQSIAFRSLLLQDSVIVETKVVMGPAPRRFAPIASVFDSWQREIFVLGQRRGALVFGIRTGLRAIELGNVYVRLDDFPGREEGDTVVLSGGVVHRAWVLSARHGDEVSAARIPMSPGLLWSSLLPFFFVLGPSVRAVSAVWLGLLIAPTGYYAARSAHPLQALAFSIVLATLGLTLAALLPGLPPPSPLEYLGTVAGLGLGWLVARQVSQPPLR